LKAAMSQEKRGTSGLITAGRTATIGLLYASMGVPIRDPSAQRAAGDGLRLDHVSSRQFVGR
jgi:hypothetical protein